MSTFKKQFRKNILSPVHTNRNIVETVYYLSHEPGILSHPVNLLTKTASF